MTLDVTIEPRCACCGAACGAVVNGVPPDDCSLVALAAGGHGLACEECARKAYERYKANGGRTITCKVTL